MAEPAAEAWFTYTEAAERLGKLKSRARREGWPVRQRNRGPHQVRLPDELLAQPPVNHGHTNGATAVELLAASRFDSGYTSAVTTVELVAELRERLGRTEGELAGLRVALEHVTAERDRLLAELVQARKGWLERLIGAVRRR